MNAPHILTDERHPEYPDLRRIVAGRDLPWKGVKGVREGEKGGWVSTLDGVQDNGWVGQDAIVGPGGVVSGNGMAMGHANVYGTVTGDARVSGTVYVSVHAEVRGGARVVGDSFIGGIVEDQAFVKGLHVNTGSSVGGRAMLVGRGWLPNDAEVTRTQHVLQVGPIGSQSVVPTLCRASNIVGHAVSIGCWTGHLDEMMEEVQRRARAWPEGYEEYGVSEYAILLPLFRARVQLWRSNVIDDV